MDWQRALEYSLESAVKDNNLTSYNLQGKSTRMNVSVKSPDQAQGNMPYIQAIFSGTEEYWDEDASGMPDLEGHTYTALGGTKVLKSTNFLRERASWTIEINTQRYDEAIEIAQAVRKYFGPSNTLIVTWSGTTQEIFIKLPANQFLLEAVEGDQKGHIEYYRVSLLITFFIQSDLSDDDVISGGIIDEIVMDTTASDGTNDADTLTKTITGE